MKNKTRSYKGSVPNLKIRNEYTCPLEMTHDVTKGKWKPILLWQLGKQSCSLSKLRSDIQGISEKVLIEQLHELISSGMVNKKKYDGYPLRVEYSLTERGIKMLEAITIMQSIGVELMLEHGQEDLLKQLGFI
jgi:DNA-binding HxlR family transcriptional regulator